VPDRTPLPFRLAKALKRARRQMTNAMRAELEPIQMPLHTVQILKRLVTQGQQSQLALARHIEEEPAGLSRLVAELESKGLVVRRRDPDDNRRVLVAATPAGQALVARAQPRLLAGIETVVSRLTRAEQSALCELLEKLAPDDEAGGEDAVAPSTAPPRGRARTVRPRASSPARSRSAAR